MPSPEPWTRTAATPELAKIVRKKVPTFPTNLSMITGAAEAVIAWSDLALAVSGTITLDIAVQHKPMIGVYKTGLASWLLAHMLLRAPLLLLPNIIAEREICPEFVPHLGGTAPIVKVATRYLLDPAGNGTTLDDLKGMFEAIEDGTPWDTAFEHAFGMTRAFYEENFWQIADAYLTDPPP